SLINNTWSGYLTTGDASNTRTDYQPLSYGAELLTDGDMEDDPTNNWTDVDATLAEETGDPGAGLKSLKVTATYGAHANAKQDIVTVAQELHKFTFIYKDTETDRSEYSIYDNSNAASILTRTRNANSTSWSENQVYYFITPAGCVSVRVALHGEDIGDLVFFDAASVRQVQ
ncbi:hypothetical protein LCGC14_2753660, partial [marine sediment metagenome]